MADSAARKWIMFTTGFLLAMIGLVLMAPSLIWLLYWPAKEEVNIYAVGLNDRVLTGWEEVLFYIGSSLVGCFAGIASYRCFRIGRKAE